MAIITAEDAINPWEKFFFDAKYRNAQAAAGYLMNHISFREYARTQAILKLAKLLLKLNHSGVDFGWAVPQPITLARAF